MKVFPMPRAFGASAETEGVAHTLSVWVYTEVSNSAELLKRLVAGELVGTFVEARVLPSLLPLQSACSRALLESRAGALKSRSMHSEVLLVLSGELQISKSLKHFGISKGTRELVVCLIDASEEQCLAVRGAVRGTLHEGGADEVLARTFDEERARASYPSITREEVAAMGWEAAVLARVAAFAI